jgi:hypothetical protein
MKHIRSLILASALFASLAPAFAQAPPPVPALPDTERRTSYVISGSTCACAVNFALYGDSTDYTNWIEVWINGVRITQSGNWTITSPTGSLATIPRPITDAVLTFTAVQTGTVQIVGAQRPRRTSQFAENRGVAARDLNQVITGLTAQLRENWDKTNDVTGRAVIAPPGETLAMLPKLANRLSQGACFDSGGNLTTCVSVPSSTFAAGAGITLTGVGPTTIAANLSVTPPLVMSGTAPINFSCPTCGTVQGTGTPTAGDLATFSTAATTPITSPGYNVRQVPGLIPSTSAVTISNGANAVVTWAAHGLSLGDTIFFCTSGGLPTGLTACVPAVGTVSANTYKSNPTLYYVAPINANTFNVATSLANAKAGTFVTTSSAGSGTHTAFANAMACAGCVGEMIWATIENTTGSAIPAVDSSPGQLMNSFTLSAGIWEVWGNGGIIKINAATPTMTHLHSGIVYGFSTIPTAPYNGTTAYTRTLITKMAGCSRTIRADILNYPNDCEPGRDQQLHADHREHCRSVRNAEGTQD